MPVWLWLVIGFAILLTFGALVDYMGNRKRSTDPASVQEGVERVKTKQETFYR